MSRQFPVLRGIAILFVVINHSITMSLWMADRFHYAGPSQPVYVLLVILKQLGLFAVPIFLFLSGAFFMYAMRDRTMERSYRTVAHNLQGTLWPYLIWSVVFYLVMALLLKETSPLPEYLKDLVVGYPYNFVPILLFFYAFSPLIAWAVRRQPVLLLVGVLFLQIVQAVVVDPSTFGIQLALPHWFQYLGMPVIRYEFALWGVFFPLGMAYQMYAGPVNQFARKYFPVILAATILLFAVHILDQVKVIYFPFAANLCPLAGAFLTPVLRRNAVPFYAWIEKVGRRSYGIYLMNLIIVTPALFALQAIFPWILQQYLILVLVLFVFTLVVTHAIISTFERPPQRMVFRYIFG